MYPQVHTPAAGGRLGAPPVEWLRPAGGRPAPLQAGVAGHHGGPSRPGMRRSGLSVEPDQWAVRTVRRAGAAV